MNLLKKYYQNRRVLVTGGAGFIGSHIVEKLVASEAQVTVLDNFSTGKVENLRSVLHKIHIIAGDITDIPTCERATLKKTHVFHLAAMVSVPDSIINPDLCFRINTSGTNNILAAAARNSVDHLVFSSSSAVYGKQAGINSEATVTSPQSPYGESKLEGEHLCKEHSQNSGLHTTILRYFNVHGKRQSARGGYAAVVAKFMDNLRNKAPLTIFGNGKQTRDFV
ncbi:NAD-dependent epimerase/dehydratase family protein, partial [bacterium]|nr:NAD-dependent epimerase/dehydratase family protein [bacterium]